MMRNKSLLIFLFCFLFFVSCFSYAASATDDELTVNPQDVQQLGLAVAQIKKLYVEPVNNNKLFADAIRGMLNGLDPHSDYLDENDFAELKAQTQGEFTGVGMEVTTEKGLVKVITPIDGSPALKAGIKPGDYIIAINNKPIGKSSLSEIIQQMRGPKGTQVILTVINSEDKKPRKITIIRDVIMVQSVKSKMLAQGYGYIRVSQFQKETGPGLVKAVQSLQKQANGHLNGLILDLRNNPGGLLDAAVDVADAFLDSNSLSSNKQIVYTKGRIPDLQMTANATPGDILEGAPLIVLINQGSASGSEVVAGALQDYKRAVVVGSQSFGKGSVQTLLPLSDKTAIKLTTALYYTPKGRSIQAQGITPDVNINNLKVQSPPEEDTLFISMIREASLSGHLANGNGLKSSSNSDNTLNEKDLATKDYQLYEALNILKALNLLQPQQAG